MQQKTMDVITYPCPNFSWSLLSSKSCASGEITYYRVRKLDVRYFQILAVHNMFDYSQPYSSKVRIKTSHYSPMWERYGLPLIWRAICALLLPLVRCMQYLAPITISNTPCYFFLLSVHEFYYKDFTIWHFQQKHAPLDQDISQVFSIVSFATSSLLDMTEDVDCLVTTMVIIVLSFNITS